MCHNLQNATSVSTPNTKNKRPLNITKLYNLYNKIKRSDCLRHQAMQPHWSAPGGILDKLCVIIFLNYFTQPLLGYIAYLLIVNHLTVLPSAQAHSCGNGPRHLVYALVYSREYKKDLILMCITVCHNCALFSSYLHYLNRLYSACECSIGTRKN